MSNLCCKIDAMVTKKRKRVTMEPELEELAGDLTPGQRRAMAGKMKRWIKQLEFTALILEIDSAPKPPETTAKGKRK